MEATEKWNLEVNQATLSGNKSKLPSKHKKNRATGQVIPRQMPHTNTAKQTDRTCAAWGLFCLMVWLE